MRELSLDNSELIFLREKLLDCIALLSLYECPKSLFYEDSYFHFVNYSLFTKTKAFSTVLHFNSFHAFDVLIVFFH